METGFLCIPFSNKNEGEEHIFEWDACLIFWPLGGCLFGGGNLYEEILHVGTRPIG